MQKIITLLAAILLLVSSPAISQSEKEAARKIDSIFAPYTSNTPGVAIAVVKNGKVIFKKGYGMADLEHNIPITPQTVFNIASVSKQFTAFAIYLLQDEGKLTLEDDIRKYIPEVPDYGTPIRIKHLLAHTSGLRDQGALLTLAGWRLDDAVTSENVIKIIARQKNLNFTPGTAFGYVNTGYSLLAEVVKRVSGKSFADYTREKIFLPLGMMNTLFLDNHEKIVKNRALSYELVGNEYFQKQVTGTSVGSSNLLTTVEDLAKWTLNFENPKVGNRQLIDAFNEPSYFDNGSKVILRVIGSDTIFHAKGQNLSKPDGLRMFTHGGHTAAFRTFMGRFPDHRLAIIALSNDEHNERLNGRWQIADFYIKPNPPQPAPTAVAPASSTVSPPPVQYSSDLKEFEGEFTSDELLTNYSFVAQNGTLIMKHSRLADLPLKRTGQNKFSGSGEHTFSFELEFLKDGDKVTGFSISNFGVKGLRFEKVM